MGQGLAIEVQNLAKHFGERGNGIQALDGVSFTVPHGSVFCILGPNGAGKTTLLKILTTVTRPDRGTARIEGYDIQAQAIQVRDCIGVVAQANRFDRYLSIWHNLTLHAQMHGIPPAEFEPEINRLLEKVGLYERRFDSADTLSGGMQRRVALIRALIHRPKVLFLDEPTTGLDPQARREIWETIQQLKPSATIILTTHYMEEADILSDHILMLHQGKVVMEGTARELKQEISPQNGYEVFLKVPKAAEYQAIIEQAGIDSVQCIDAYRLQFILSNPNELQRVMTLIPPHELHRIGEVEMDLESVFIAVATQQGASEEIPIS
jgi:ABC-2 type transport system ATP-binding protein